MTIVGLHTTGELKDFLAAKNVEVLALKKAFQNFPEWTTKDKATSDEWLSDYTALTLRYNAAAANANLIIADAVDHGISPAIAPAEKQWQSVILALKQDGEFAAPKKGDAIDLANRIVKAGGKLPDDHVPQPTSPDTDLNAYQATGNFLNQLQSKGLSSLGILGIMVAVATIGYVGFLALPILVLPRR